MPAISANTATAEVSLLGPSLQNGIRVPLATAQKLRNMTGPLGNDLLASCPEFKGCLLG